MDNNRSINTQSATILIADDVAANRFVLERHLKRLGHTVFVAEHGQAALELLHQLLTNLLSNSCKYTPPGGTIRVSAHLRDPLTVEVQVRDNGIGIKPTDQERVFEKFFRSADGQVVKEQGSGLGLSITRHLVELHGGTIGLESTPGSGTTVTFTLLTAG